MKMRKIALLFFPLLCFSLLASSAFAAAGNLENGKKVYEKRCWWCHGEKGEGDGPAAERLNPPPRSFADGVYKFKSTQGDDLPSDDDLFRVVSKGLFPETAMPGWEDMLKKQEMWDVIAYIKSLGEGVFEESKFRTIDYGGEVPSSPESIARGKKIFHNKAACNECHGDEGRGDGIKAMKDDIFSKRVWPRDQTQPWTYRGGATAKDIYTRVTTGIPGTPMPAFTKGTKKLTNAERWDVANYVVSLQDVSKKPNPAKKVVKATAVPKVPTKVSDPVWKGLKGLAVPLVPNLIAKERFFTPTNASVLVKAVFDKKKIAFLLAWDDRTGSILGDNDVEKLSEGGKMFQDAVAIQFPQVIPTSLQKPYFGHGDKEESVNMLYWGAGSKDKRNMVALMDAKGFGTRKPRDAAKSGFTAVGEYHKGEWKVLMTRDLKTNQKADLQFEAGKFIPFALANWDGSNTEKGSRHTLTTWYWLLMAPTLGSEIYVYPGLIAFILIVFQLLYAKSQRSRFS